MGTRAARRPVSAGRNEPAGCPDCGQDHAFLTSTIRPPYESLRPAIRVVDLFAGCGGLSLGVAEAARRIGLGTEVVLALDNDSDAVAAYRANFRHANVLPEPVEHFFDGINGERLTSKERRVRSELGRVDVLVGGPPCQGHSDLNNRTRRDDPRNALYARMARAARVLRPRVVLIENVPTVQHDLGRVVDVTMEALEDAEFVVDDAVVDLSCLGVPQTRRRHVVLAIEPGGPDPTTVFDGLQTPCERHDLRTVRWAIGDLLNVEGRSPFDTPSTPSAENQARMEWLLKHGEYDLPNDRRPACHQSSHSYGSMYGRLDWNRPAQTVTTGFGSMGQGRYVHPARPRTLTPHEAARLQMLPDFWDLSAARTKGSLARLIGNAVPPMLAISICSPVFENLFRSQADTEVVAAAPSPARATRRSRPGQSAAVRRSVAVPAASSPEARRRMQATRRQNTGAEQLLKAELDSLNLEYDEHVSILPGSRRKVDFAFPEHRIAVFVDGCFWHSCPVHATVPKANGAWWRDKLDANQRRDRDTDDRLREAGWTVLRFWEHEDASSSAEAILGLLSTRQTPILVGGGD